jgi:hypothetical protein
MPVKPARMKPRDVRPVIAGLQEEVQKNLLDFLWAEASIARTMCELVRTTSDPAHELQLREKIKRAIATMRHFVRRVASAAQRKEINHAIHLLQQQADQLPAGAEARFAR